MCFLDPFWLFPLSVTSLQAFDNCHCECISISVDLWVWLLINLNPRKKPLCFKRLRNLELNWRREWWCFKSCSLKEDEKSYAGPGWVRHKCVQCFYLYTLGINSGVDSRVIHFDQVNTNPYLKVNTPKVSKKIVGYEQLIF